MSIHYLHLHPEPFQLIATNKKTIESRLFDDKRKLINVNDSIIFINRAKEDETIATKVTALHRAGSFHDLFTDNDLIDKFSTHSIDSLEEGVNKYYSPEDQRKYGVIGIEFMVIK